MAKTRDRIFILVIAGAFLFTTVGVSLAFLWQIMQEGKTEKSETSQSQRAQTEAAKKQQQDNPNALKGKPLQDFKPIAKVDKLEIIDLEPGNGQEVKAGDKLTVDYTGAIASTGKVFESSLDAGQPAKLGLDQVIAGWKEGLPGMKVDGKRRLIIPAEKAYGSQSPSPDIPTNSALVFDITLRSIDK